MTLFDWNAMDLGDVEKPMQLYECVMEAYVGPTGTSLSNLIEDLAGVVVHGRCHSHKKAAHFMYLLTIYKWLSNENPEDDYSGLEQRIHDAWDQYSPPTPASAVSVVV